MSSTTSPLLGLPFIQPSQAQKHVTHNEALRILDAVAQLRVLAFDAVVPPATPAAGDVFALGTAAGGDWTGQDGRLALWDGTGWIFIAPREGWRAWDAQGDRLRVRDDGVWQPVVPWLAPIDGIGINTGYDEANRLSVAAHATILSHDGAGHQVKVNKAEPTETASVLFQSGWTGHAEMGLAGDNDFAIKVSGGGAWNEALKVARASGRVTLPQGAVVNGAVTGSAVQSGPTDATPGRLLAAGAYGLGGHLPPIGNAAATTGGIVPGLYAYDTSAGSSGGPANVTRGSLLHTRRAAGAGETQVLVVEASAGAGAAPGTSFGRSRATGAWTPWICGSVQESGSGANGRWVRHQDGTQTCWHVINDDAAAWTTPSGALYVRSAHLEWAFPAAFAAAPVVTGSVRRGELGAWGVSVRGVSATSVLLYPWGSVQRIGGESKELALVATGRWY